MWLRMTRFWDCSTVYAGTEGKGPPESLLLDVCKRHPGRIVFEEGSRTGRPKPSVTQPYLPGFRIAVCHCN